MDWTPHAVKNNIYIYEFYSMFKHTYDKTFVFSGESHNFWECLYVMSGSICVCADERVYNMGAGEIIFHKPHELHKFYVTGGKNAELFIFSYSAEGEMCSYFYDKVFYLSDKQQKIIANLIEYMDAQKKEYNLNGESAYFSQYIDPFDIIQNYSQAVANYIYMLLFSLFNDSKAKPVSISHDATVFGEAVNYMNSRIYESPSVDEISKNVGISSAGLKRIFKQYSGLGVHKYFLKLKLKLAAELLEDGNTVTYTAERLGFSSQGYFTKTFRREMGFLPSEVTKKLK